MLPHPAPDPDAVATGSDKRVHYYLSYRWNDMIDPNFQYSTDAVKAAFADAISGGTAAAYRISITWSGEAVVTVGVNGEVLSISQVSDSGDALDGYPLR
jgi:hypothetical protein